MFFKKPKYEMSPTLKMLKQNIEEQHRRLMNAKERENSIRYLAERIFIRTLKPDWTGTGAKRIMTHEVSVAHAHYCLCKARDFFDTLYEMKSRGMLAKRDFSKIPFTKMKPQRSNS